MHNTTQPTTIGATELSQKTGETLRRVGANGEHIIIERGQFPIAVLIPVADYKALLEDKKRVEQSLPKAT